MSKDGGPAFPRSNKDEIPEYREEAKNLPEMHCHFCGKYSKQVGCLIMGPKDIGICDECIHLALEVVALHRTKVFPMSLLRDKSND